MEDRRRMDISNGSEEVEKHAFSIELKSREHLKLVAIPNDTGDNVLIEGFLGELEAVDLVEDVMLEVRGTNGTLKMDLKEQELNKLCKEITRRY
jgi:hypothetical protein